MADVTEEWDSLQMDRYTQVVTICNNLALIVSQCAADQFVVRVKILSQLENCWTNGYNVMLQPDDTSNEDIDMKPDVEDIENQSLVEDVDETNEEEDGEENEDEEYHDETIEYVSNDDEVVDGSRDHINAIKITTSKSTLRMACHKSLVAQNGSLSDDIIATANTMNECASEAPINLDDNQEGLSDCPTCSKTFRTTAALTKHMLLKHAEDITDTSEAKEEGLTEAPPAASQAPPTTAETPPTTVDCKEVRGDSTSDGLRCVTCDMSFKKPAALIRHKRLKHSDRPLVLHKFHCDACGASFARRKRLVNHRKEFHSQNIEGFDDKSGLCMSGNNQCPICLLILGHRSNFLRHMRKHTMVHESKARNAKSAKMMNTLAYLDPLNSNVQSVVEFKGSTVSVPSKPDPEPVLQIIAEYAPGTIPHDRLMKLVPSAYCYNMTAYTTEENAPEDSFTSEFQVNISSKEEFSEWLKLFQTKNSTQFNIILSKSGKGRSLDFKQFLKCIHCVKGGVIGKGKHTGCSARMTVTIRTRKRNTLDVSCKLFDTHCVIQLVWNHNHPLLAPETLKHHSVAPEVDQQLVQLLRHGHSIKSALKCIQMEVDENITDDSPVTECTQTSRSLLPDYQHSYYIFQRKFKKVYGDSMSTGGIIKLIENINAEAGEICVLHEEYQDSNLIAICAPFMKRVHLNIPESAEMVFIETSGEMHKGKNAYYVYVFMTNSKAGALPLAVGISPSESTEHLTRLFNLIKNVIPTDSFYGRGSVNGPRLFKTDDNIPERTALFSVWPQSRPMLCQFRIIQTQWRYLLSSQNGIDQRERPALFAWVKKLVYAPTEIESLVQFERYQLDPIVVKNYVFREQIIGLFMRREEWCTAMMPDELPSENPTNSYVDASMRALKDQIFDQTRTFKLSQMVDFMTDRFSSYYKRRLEDFSCNRLCRPASKYPRYEGQAIIEVSEDVYEVSSVSEALNLTYTVNTATTICTCQEWETGKMCKHLHYVFTRRKTTASTHNYYAVDRELMHRIATDSKMP